MKNQHWQTYKQILKMHQKQYWETLQVKKTTIWSFKISRSDHVPQSKPKTAAGSATSLLQILITQGFYSTQINKQTNKNSIKNHTFSQKQPSESIKARSKHDDATDKRMKKGNTNLKTPPFLVHGETRETGSVAFGMLWISSLLLLLFNLFFKSLHIYPYKTRNWIC